MTSTSVVLLPVGLIPVEGEQLRVMVYSPRGAWLSRPLDQGEPVRMVGALANEVVSSVGGAVEVKLEPVAFQASSSEVSLVYTCVMPLATSLAELGTSLPPSGPPRDWVALAPWHGEPEVRPPRLPSGVHMLVLNYWRRQLEETNAAFDFLPRYFTTSQVRAVYSSVWGYRQNPGSFHRWLHKNNNGARSEAGTDRIREEVDGAFAEGLQDSSLRSVLKDSTVLLSKGTVGVSPFVSGAVLGAPAAAFPGILPALRVAAGFIAYQNRLAPGPPPDWFERTQPGRSLLVDPYPPRPMWMPSGEAPPEFH